MPVSRYFRCSSRILRLAILAIVGLALTAPSAQAAFWPPWPPSTGGGSPPPIEPGPGDVGGEIVLEPEPEPIGGSPDSESPPEMQEAPEPATLLTGLIGMSAAGAFALRRRRT